MVPRGNRTFLASPIKVDIGVDGAVMLHAYFERARFSRALFTENGIAVPPQLSNAVPSRHADFLAGRLLARRAMRDLGIEAEELPIGPDRAPVWPKGVHGAISHTAGYCAALVTRNVGQTAGVDVECAMPDDVVKSIRQLFMNDEEANVLASSPLPPPLAAASVFSAKETIYKALFPHVRSFFGFDAALLQSLTRTHLTFCLTSDLSSSLGSGTRINVSLMALSDHVMTWLLYNA